MSFWNWQCPAGSGWGGWSDAPSGPGAPALAAWSAVVSRYCQPCREADAVGGLTESSAGPHISQLAGQAYSNVFLGLACEPWSFLGRVLHISCMFWDDLSWIQA